jgi:hypothetical protein
MLRANGARGRCVRRARAKARRAAAGCGRCWAPDRANNPRGGSDCA